MSNRMIVVIGGARSGKSSFAQRLAAACGRQVCFLATAEARDGEMHQRIEHHRNSRPDNWNTLELERGVRLGELPAGTDVVLFDCFTVYLSNLMASAGLDWPPEEEDLLSGTEVDERMEKTEREALLTVDRLREVTETLILVTNEVGAGLVPPFRLGRIFRDLAGRLNQCLADKADEVHLVCAGLPLRLKPADSGEIHGHA